MVVSLLRNDSGRPDSIDSELAAFSAVLDDFLAATRRARGRLGADQELTLSQYHLLEPLLDGAEPLGVCALAEAAGVSAPTATRVLAVLERDDLVERRACRTTAATSTSR